MTPSRRSPDRSTGDAFAPRPLWRQALAGLGLRLSGGPASVGSADLQRQQQLEQELEEAIRLGRWVGEEERALLEQQAVVAFEARRQQERRRLQRRGVLLMAGLAIVVPVLWPLVLIGVIYVFPRTSRRLLIAVLALVAASVLAVVLLVGQWLHRPSPPAVPPSTPPAQSSRPQS